ncbi:MAG: hypothetical protein NT175_00330 [Bacteroidetes bacterium]|nr:hypothetical protein [Bacteroidota bacterium]
MKKIYFKILFIIALIGVSMFYNYPEIALKRPQSVHKWRQSDCASIALNYYQGGMKFFLPETHNLTSDAGTSGKCCTSEIPILYYTVASLYKVFGYHEYIYRIFNTLLFFLGLFFLSRLLYYLLKDVFWAIALPLLFFTSPILVYYGNNFLSNSSSLAFSIVGWYYFIRFSFESKPKWFYISMFIFMIAAAFKITGLFSLFAITGIYIVELLGLKNFNENHEVFNRHVRFLIPIISIFMIIGLWIFYAYNFNQKHDCTYFSTTIFPIWNLDRTEINGVLDNIRKIWIDQYFHRSVLLFLTICFFFVLICFRKNNKLLIYSMLFILAEVIVYIILQFWTFADHDYYTIDMYILPVLIVISTFDVLKRHFNKIFSSKISKVVFSLFLLFNIYYAHQKINERYKGWMNDFHENRDIYSITPYLRQMGISSNDTIISIPDNSHVSLYLMNQKGWTEYTDERFNRGKRIHYNQDSIGIQSSIDKGAKYLIINGVKELYTKPYVQSYCSNLIGHYNNVLIFNLKDSGNNFNIVKRTIDTIFKCNAELLSSDRQFFISEIDNTLFQFGTTQSDEFAHTGKYSSKIDASSPYGMTIKFKDLKNGESFAISVWRKTNDKSKSGLIASGVYIN